MPKSVTELMDKKRRADPETMRLIEELLTRAGMIMEDASVNALLRDALAGSLTDRVDALEKSAASITAIMKAARAFLNG